MPYIPLSTRGILDGFDNEVRRTPDNPGELNYRITMVILKYLLHRGLSYQTVNDILGALEGAKLEFYRRVAVDYERGKCEENGDVYPRPVGR